MNSDVITFPPPDPELSPLAWNNPVYHPGDKDAGSKLHHFLSKGTGISPERIRSLIEFGSVWIDGKVCGKAETAVKAGCTIHLQVPAYGPVRFYEADESRILHEDKWILAYNKESGIPCQQTPYDGYNHLFGALKRMMARRKKGRYLALHHRLDGPTSGVMVFSKDKKANSGLSRMFSESLLKKEYVAAASGRSSSDGWREDRPIAKRKGGYYCPENGQGKRASTEFEMLEQHSGPAGDYFLARARPLTGRTHQIRLHLAASGHPVVGDRQYGGPPARRLMLHAHRLTLEHPVTGEPLVLTAPMPEGFSGEEIE